MNLLQKQVTVGGGLHGHTDPGAPPRITEVNAKLSSARIKKGSTDETHHIEIEVKSGVANDLQNGEKIARVKYGTPYEEEGVQTIGIPAVPQTSGYEARNQDRYGYDLVVAGGLQNGSVVSIRPIVVDSRG